MKGPTDARQGPRFLYRDTADVQTDVGRRVNPDFLGDEEAIVRRLAAEARLDAVGRAKVRAAAVRLVGSVRRERAARSGLDAFLRKYDLSSQEGVILMCLAEALLRIPDDDTADRLIADKIRAGDWESHLGDSESLFVNASTWGLLLTGRMVGLENDDSSAPGRFVGRLVTRMGEPMVRGAMRQAMRIMGHQFVMGRTIGEALERSLKGDNAAYRYSFDMLGEAALTAPDAERYFGAYRDAIATVGRGVAPGTPSEAAASISVKLSALHPRYERSNRGKVLAELGPRLIELGQGARAAGVALTVDAEESERLEL
jgi:RHH-type proline utilization regulon transcriptional repressor/proline dehydrogenase/delta 1-pyrroline-5-carboxylate dehydrogenase